MPTIPVLGPVWQAFVARLGQSATTAEQQAAAAIAARDEVVPAAAQVAADRAFVETTAVTIEEHRDLVLDKVLEAETSANLAATNAGLAQIALANLETIGRVATKAALPVPGTIDAGTIYVVQVDESRAGEVAALYRQESGAWVYVGGALATNARLQSIVGADNRLPGDTRLLVGIVRPDGAGGWLVLDDAGHTPRGLQSVTIEAGMLRVTYPGAVEVIGASVTCDETLARLGYTVGPSVGTSSMDIMICHPGASGMIVSSGGTWVLQSSSNRNLTGITYSTGTGTIQITHNAVGAYAVPVVSPAQATTTERYQVVSYAQSYTNIQRLDASGTVLTGSVPASRAFAFQRIGAGPDRVEPSTVTATTGNLWVIAIVRY